MLLFAIVSSCGNKKAQADAEDDSVLTEEKAIEVIKKANLNDTTRLSAEFQSIYEDGNLLCYGAEPDCVYVNNPNIKILKIISNDKDRFTVIFDFIDKDNLHMGWISQQEFIKKLCGVNIIRENNRWVVDDYLEAWDSSLENFLADASSYRKNVEAGREIENETANNIEEESNPYSWCIGKWKGKLDTRMHEEYTIRIKDDNTCHIKCKYFWGDVRTCEYDAEWEPVSEDVIKIFDYDGHYENWNGHAGINQKWISRWSMYLKENGAFNHDPSNFEHPDGFLEKQ